jgi:hypothetical protein
MLQDNGRAASVVKRKLRAAMSKGGGTPDVPSFAALHQNTVALKARSQPGGILADGSVIVSDRLGKAQIIGWPDKLQGIAQALEGTCEEPRFSVALDVIEQDESRIGDACAQRLHDGDWIADVERAVHDEDRCCHLMGDGVQDVTATSTDAFGGIDPTGDEGLELVCTLCCDDFGLPDVFVGSPGTDR